MTIDARHRLRAETLIPLRAPHAVMAGLLDHFGEHGEVSGAGDAWSVTFEIGSAAAALRPEGIEFRVEASDDTSLSFLQWSVVEHVLEFAPGETPDITWSGGIGAGAPLPYFREMEVVAAEHVTPHMRRVTLSGRDLSRFAHDGIHVRLLLPPRPGVQVVWPVMAADGRQAWPEGERPVSRVYTIRRIDVAVGEIEIDFVLHEGDYMPGAHFGSTAEPGVTVGMTGPGGGNLKVAGNYLFFGDETALPAISRLLEELPSAASAKAFVEIKNDSERQDLTLRPGVELTWLSREGRPAGTGTLLADALSTLGSEAGISDAYVWAGCEFSTARAFRDHLKRVVNLPKGRSLVTSYWRRGQAGEFDD
jgi:NADPH-dependent ferric siderophore reductase